MPLIRRPGDRPRVSARPASRRRLAVVLLSGLVVITASGCSGSTAPEPGEHETQHDRVRDTVRTARLPPAPPGAALAGAATVGRA